MVWEILREENKGEGWLRRIERWRKEGNGRVEGYMEEIVGERGCR